MTTVCVVLVSLLLGAILHGDALAAGCRPCAFGGLCSRGGALVPCMPSESACATRRGLLIFNSVLPDTPAYWTLFTSTWGRARGSVKGRLDLWADYTVARPSVPGLPETCNTEDHICTGKSARFSGRVRNDRLNGVARYPDGSSCEFKGVVTFGLGSPVSNTFLCRNPGGELVSEGYFKVQGIRLQGCRRRPAY